MPTITCIDDLRLLARQRVPKMFYDYVDGGSWTETTYRANERNLAEIELRQRVAIDVGERSTASRLVGESVSMPIALAPTGLAGMQHPDGEIHAARAAEKFGVPFTLSTMSICSLEEVAKHTTKPFWFQLYVMRDRAFVESLIDRAKAARCSALMLTVDLPLSAQRNKDIHNGLSAPPRPTRQNIMSLLARPRWCLGMLQTSRRGFGNVQGHVQGIDGLSSLSAWVANQFDATLNWKDVEWIKQRWGGKLILKGILDAEDARLAVESGADTIVVSNHGGRQLDGASSTIRALPPIVDAVGSQIEVLMDGGIRSGGDVFKAIASGARGALIGRPFLYGLGALGEQGVTRCLEMLHHELDVTMALCGVRSVDAISADMLVAETLHRHTRRS